MTKVLAPGCWDLLHIGHVRFLQAAKNYGDHLTVGCASDEVIFQDKGAFPIINQIHRVEMLGALSCVDDVFLYKELDFISCITYAHPNIFAVGQHWGCDARHQDVNRYAELGYFKLRVIPYTHEISTTIIRNKIR